MEEFYCPPISRAHALRGGRTNLLSTQLIFHLVEILNVINQSSLNKSTVQTSSNFEMFADKAQQFTVQRIVDICGFEFLAVELACDWLGLFCNFQPNSSQYSC